MDDSKTFQEGVVQKRVMELLENELSVTNLPQGQSISMIKRVAKKVLRNQRETFRTNLQIYSLNVEVLKKPS